MKNSKLIKMALLGLSHGLLLSGNLEASVSDKENLEALMSSNRHLFSGLSANYLAAGCGGKGKCGTIADRDVPNGGKDTSKTNGNGKDSTQPGQYAAGCSSCRTIADRDVPNGGKDTSKTNENGKDSTQPGQYAAGCGGKGKCGSIVADRDINVVIPADKTQQKSGNQTSSNKDYSDDFGHLMTEDELLLELNPEGVKLYKTLTPEGKELARQVASQYCNGRNLCAGLNACQTEKNACLGKGNCKGQSKCSISDKNVAVKLVSEKMAAKRQGALKSGE
jgi:hypothetical protein